MKISLTFIAALLSLSINAQPDYIKSSTTVPTHPRLLLLKGEEARIKGIISSDATWGYMHNAILSECDKLLQLPPVERIQIGRRLLDKSRECLRRVFFLSYAWRTTKDKKYFDRAEKELLAVAAFSDWNPSHFLDVAEMTTSVAIGYDWLYNDLSASSRTQIREALLHKGLEPSLDTKNNSWLSASHNWNQVCNAGMAYGALAIYEDQPDLARKVLNRSIESVKIPMKEYAPDGAYMEGYGYWGYGTSYNVLLVSMLEKAFQTDFGLSDAPGFLKTAGFMLNMTGPSHKPFNFSDAGNGEEIQPAMFWFADKLKDPSLLFTEQRHIAPKESARYLQERLLPATLIWAGGLTLEKIHAPEPTAWVGQGKNPVALFRSSWVDSTAVYVAVKAGSPSLNHAHMDVGSFVMDAEGVRWAMDFGMQNYESLESQKVDLWNMKQNSQRWEVFRYNNFAHNTLTVNKQLQDVDGAGRLYNFIEEPGSTNVLVDMALLYKKNLSKSVRSVGIVDDRYVRVADDITTGDHADTIRWNMLTEATVKLLSDTTAQLSKNGKTLLLQVTGPPSMHVRLQTWPTTPPHTYDAPNPNTQFVGFEVIVPPNQHTWFAANLVPPREMATQPGSPKK